MQFPASPLVEELTIDGHLNEALWGRVDVITGFLQREPVQLSPATYDTEVRVVFDDDALYVAATCHQPRASIRVQDLARDFSDTDNDLFSIAIDGFLDKRNTVVFQTTPHGSQRELEVIDGSEVNLNWNARWIVRTQINETGWTAEIVIPWDQLRYPSDADRFGVIFARNVRSLNEQTSLPAVPRVYSVHRMAYEGTLFGIVPPAPKVNVQLNPYFLSRRLRDNATGTDRSEGDVGGELKWAITPSTVLDLSVNTDFAQADADRQAVNLDRFSVFFPERRQFFLESANIFTASVTEWIRPFFSRRIGLDRFGNPIPLDGGARLTSRSSTQQLGVLAMRQRAFGASPASDFAVARYSRNLSTQSRLGGMLTYRQDQPPGPAGNSDGGKDNATLTVDGLWRPTQSFGVQGMLSASDDDRTGGGFGAQLWAFYRSDRLYLSSLQYYNKDYDPGMGLELLDTNYVMHNLSASLDIRSGRLPGSLRSINPGFSVFAFRSADDGDSLFGYATLRPLRLRFQNGAQLDFTAEPNWQRLDSMFSPAGIDIGPGNYSYVRYGARAKSDQSAKLAAEASVETGDYFDGRLTHYMLSARLTPSPHIALSADLDISRLRDLGIAAENTTTRLYGLNARLALNPRLQLNGSYQQSNDSERRVLNVRLAWEYRPLSYLYLVYNKNEGDGLAPGERIDRNRFIAKLSYLFDI